MTEEIEIKLPDLSRVALEPGDKLLVRSPKRISNAAAEAIGKAVRKTFPDHGVLLLDEDLELSVIRPTNAGSDLADFHEEWRFDDGAGKFTVSRIQLSSADVYYLEQTTGRPVERRLVTDWQPVRER